MPGTFLRICSSDVACCCSITSCGTTLMVFGVSLTVSGRREMPVGASLALPMPWPVTVTCGSTLPPAVAAVVAVAAACAWTASGTMTSPAEAPETSRRMAFEMFFCCTAYSSTI